jgi:hypothetical protein
VPASREDFFDRKHPPLPFLEITAAPATAKNSRRWQVIGVTPAALARGGFRRSFGSTHGT